MTLLCDLCVKYGTDKGPQSMGGWGYSPIYFERMSARRHEVKNVLEIGICGYRNIPNNVVGASLFVWRDFFPNATIHGIDNDARFIFNDQDRIKTYLCDAYDAAAMDDLLGTIGVDYDFVVDDAVHDPLPQLLLVRSLYPHLAFKAVYSMEDVCPYKIPCGDITAFTELLPEGVLARVHSTHKDERLILIDVDPVSY